MGKKDKGLNSLSSLKKELYMTDKRSETSFLFAGNIYRDHLNRLILYRRKTKQAYLIQKNDEAKLSFYQYRILLVAALFVVLTVFGISVLYAGICSIAVLVLLQFMYMNFLKTLTPVKKFTPKDQESILNRMAKGFTKKKLMLRGLVFFAVGILVVLNGIYSHFSTDVMIVNYVILACCTVFGILNLAASSHADS